MKNPAIFLLSAILTLAACSHAPAIEELQLFSATENYPEDIFFNSETNKKALIIVAHDDDDCAMSGTIAKLTSEGWKIKQLSLSMHPMNDGSGNNPAGIICEGNEAILADGIYRPGVDTIEFPYLPIPYTEINKQFLTTKVAQVLISRINSFKPSVIFTLDNIKGGYGHPAHIFISQLVLDLYEEGLITTDRIYQSVYTDHMEKEIVDNWLAERMKRWGYPHASTIANELYSIDGMPEPDVQINITAVAETKMKYLRAYPQDVRKNLRKFIPYYEEFDADTYFSIFDREFFRVIEH